MPYIRFFTHNSIDIVNVTTGCFSRSRGGKLFVNESQTWKCTGFPIYNNFGKQVDFLNLESFYDALKNNPAKLFYKNGKARFRVSDNDHGTPRQWGQTFTNREVTTSETI
mgnify:CR=1 FL=1